MRGRRTLTARPTSPRQRSRPGRGSCTSRPTSSSTAVPGPYREDDPVAPRARVRPREGRGRAGGDGRRSVGRRRADVADLRRRGALRPRAPHPRRRRRRAPISRSSPTSCAAPCGSPISPARCSRSCSTDAAGPLHLAGADGVSRYEFACLVAAAQRPPRRPTCARRPAPRRRRSGRATAGSTAAGRRRFSAPRCRGCGPCWGRRHLEATRMPIGARSKRQLASIAHPSAEQPGHDVQAAGLEPFGWRRKDQRGDPRRRGAAVVGCRGHPP